MPRIKTPYGEIVWAYDAVMRRTRISVVLELSDLDRAHLSVDAVCDTTDGYLRDVIRGLRLREHTKPDA